MNQANRLHAGLARLLSALLLAACATPALAHPGAHHDALAAGFLHPLTGLDHLLALAAAGLCSARWQHGQRLRPLFLPLFLLSLLAGALAGQAGLALPWLETGLAATVVATGLLALAATRVPPAVALPLFAAFAVLHGNAHGLELPLSAMAGFIAASALLLVAGRALGAWAAPVLVRTAGAGVAVAGLAMLAA